MKIHYISDHAVLEYDEVQMFLDMGHEVFSNGAYLDPAGHFSLPRPGLKGAKYYEDLANIARTTPRTAMPKEMIDPFDVIIVMHAPEVLKQNWENFRNKRVIWRSIGQSTRGLELSLTNLRQEGLKIVRYSPKERNIPNFIGEDAMIRFYKDPEVYKGWTGENVEIVNFTQSLKGRREFCHYDTIFPVIEYFNGKIYGPGNEDIGQFNGGNVTYEQQIEIMQKSMAMVYAGTWPAPYTLSFIEAMMTGLPIIAGSKALAHIARLENIDFYEVDEMLAEIGGLVANSPAEMITLYKNLKNNRALAEEISRKQRSYAIKHFGKKTIMKQWEELLNAN